jgi:hypothetical protein
MKIWWRRYRKRLEQENTWVCRGIRVDECPAVMGGPDLDI